MNITGMKTELGALARIMGDKGLQNPRPQYWIKPDSDDLVWVEWGTGKYKTIYGADPYDAISAAMAWVNGLPSPEEAHRNEFLRLAAAAADYGRDNGITAKFINPLVEAMKRLSENALTDQREVEK